MVNVDKRIKSAEKQAAPATVRRPRNQALNSSKTRKAPMSAKAHQVLNSSKKSSLTRSEFLRSLNCSTNGWDKYYNRMSSEQLADFYSVPVEDIIDWDNAIEQNGYGKVVEHLVSKPEYELDELDQLDVLDDGTVGYAIAERGSDGNAVRFYGVNVDDIASRVGGEDEGYDDATIDAIGAFEEENGVTAERPATKEDVDDIDASVKGDTNLDSGCDSKKQDMDSKLNCSEEETKIVTESGNEVSLSDIQIIQDPNTNEIALFIQEDPDEAIPEGFTVIGVASQPALPAVDGEGAVCPECGQDPCVCEGDENLDSSATPRQS